MVYTAWLCCIVLSILQNLCGMFKCLVSQSFIVLVAFCVRKKERDMC